MYFSKWEGKKQIWLDSIALSFKYANSSIGLLIESWNVFQFGHRIIFVYNWKRFCRLVCCGVVWGGIHTPPTLDLRGLLTLISDWCWCSQRCLYPACGTFPVAICHLPLLLISQFGISDAKKGAGWQTINPRLPFASKPSRLILTPIPKGRRKLCNSVVKYHF